MLTQGGSDTEPPCVSMRTGKKVTIRKLSFEHEKRSHGHRSFFRRRRVARNAYRLLHRRERTAVNASVAQIYFELGRTRQRSLNESLAERILDVLLKRPA